MEKMEDFQNGLTYPRFTILSLVHKREKSGTVLSNTGSISREKFTKITREILGNLKLTVKNIPTKLKDSRKYVDVTKDVDIPRIFRTFNQQGFD